MSMNKDNPSDADISDLYRTTQSDGPDAALDAAILAQAEAATKPKRKRPAWIAPVGLAATMLLGVNLAMNLKDFSSEPNIYSESSVASAKNSAPAADSDDIESLANAPASPVPERQPALQLDLESTKGFYSNQPPTVVLSQGNNAATHESSAFGSETSPPQPETERDLSDETEELNEAVNRQRILSQIESRVEAKQDLREAPGLRERLTLPQAVVAEPEYPATTNTPFRTPQRPAIVTAPAPERQVSEASSDSFNKENAKQSQAPVEPPASASVANDEDPQHAAATVTTAASSAESVNGDRTLEEVVVAGTQAAKRQETARLRLQAIDQAKRSQGQMTNSLVGTTPPPSQTESSEPYVCDLEKLNVDKDSIETAKFIARSFEPPLNAVSWPGYIRELAQSQDYTRACAQLAAYHQLFPDVASLFPLPVVLPPEK